tara:strand:- start:1 stop:147 length:147 start_codon:yes stop_codon:yes gene_type:complete
MKQIKIKINSNIKEVKGNLFKKNTLLKVKAKNVIYGKINLAKKKQIKT